MCVCDQDQVIAVSGGSRKRTVAKILAASWRRSSRTGENILVDNKGYKYIQITDNDREDFTGEAVSPFSVRGDAIGAVVILSREPKQLLGDGTEAGHFCRRVPGKTDGAVIIKTPHLDRKICSDAALFKFYLWIFME